MIGANGWGSPSGEIGWTNVITSTAISSTSRILDEQLECNVEVRDELCSPDPQFGSRRPSLRTSSALSSSEEGVFDLVLLNPTANRALASTIISANK